MKYDTGIMKNKTAKEMVDNWQEASAIIKKAYSDLKYAKTLLEDTFGKEAYMEVIARERLVFNPDEAYSSVQNENNKRAWRKIIDILGIRKTMSNKRLKELDENIENNKMLDLTLENIQSISEGMVESAGEYAKEAILEVYEFLRLGASHNNKYKTNDKYAKFELGKKVIIPYAIETRYYHTISRYKRDSIISVDRIFHLMDGKGELKGYNGPLVDTIQSSEYKAGETEYFKFKCYENGNLHLEFKRPDLVAKLNAVAGNPTHLKGR